MDAPSTSYLATGSSSRYAGVARYLASLETAGSDLETPPGHPDKLDLDLDDRRQQQAAATAKPEMATTDDVIRGSDSSPALRVRHKVFKFSLLLVC